MTSKVNKIRARLDALNVALTRCENHAAFIDEHSDSSVSRRWRRLSQAYVRYVNLWASL